MNQETVVGAQSSVLEKCSVLCGCRPIKITQLVGMVDPEKKWHVQIDGNSEMPHTEGYGSTVEGALAVVFGKLIQFCVTGFESRIVILDGEIDSRREKAAAESKAYADFCKRWGLEVHTAFVREYKR